MPSSPGRRSPPPRGAGSRPASRRASAGGSGSSGSSSVLTGPPSRASGQPAKLCHTSRLDAGRPCGGEQVVGAFGAQAVGRRERLLEVRPRLRPGSAVSWCTTTSGRAAATASRTAARVERVDHHRLGAELARRPSAVPGERVVPRRGAPRDELRDEAATEGAGRAGEEDAHFF